MFRYVMCSVVSLQDMCMRNNFPISPHHKMKYYEAAFFLGEQLAVLGIVRNGVSANNLPVKLMEPVSVFYV